MLALQLRASWQILRSGVAILALACAPALLPSLVEARSDRFSVCVRNSVFDPIYKATRADGDTTGLRWEAGHFVKAPAVDELLEDLKKIMGVETLDARDVAAAGRVNVTETDYAVRLKIDDEPGLLLGRSGTIRVRRYGDRVIGSHDVFEPSELTRGRSKLEIKLDHPTEENVVFKPSVIVEDSDIERLLGGFNSFYRDGFYLKAWERTKALNPNKQSEVDQVFRSLKNVYEDINHRRRSKFLPQFLPHRRLEPYQTVEYERTAYALKPPYVGGRKPAPVQITVDQNVRYRFPGQGKGGSLGPFKPDERVVEVKVPLDAMKGDRMKLKEENPQLAAIIERFERFNDVTIPGFNGQGKAGAYVSYLKTTPIWHLRAFAVRNTNRLLKDLKRSPTRFVARNSVALAFAAGIVWAVFDESPVDFFWSLIERLGGNAQETARKLDPILQSLERAQRANTLQELDAQLAPLLRTADLTFEAPDADRKALQAEAEEAKEQMIARLREKLAAQEGEARSDFFQAVEDLYLMERTHPSLVQPVELAQALESLKDDEKFLARLKSRVARMAEGVRMAQAQLTPKK
jgi:hypothetical protein